MSKPKVTVFWFRRDLRLHDNHGLYQALSGQYPVLPVFVFDREILSAISDPYDKRMDFIHQTLEKMNRDLQKVGASIMEIHARPVDAFKQICAGFDVQNVFANHDYEPYARKRDELVGDFLKVNGIPFFTLKDQVIFEKSEIMKNDGRPYQVYTPYVRSWKKKLQESELPHYPSEQFLHKFLKMPPQDLPKLKDPGFSDWAPAIPPEVPDIKKITSYHATRDFPGSDGTLRTGIHLRFGTASIRQMVRLGQQWNVQWLNQLIWREFFIMILYHYPQVVTENFNKKYDRFRWRNDEGEFHRWCRGETGYLLVDAGMRELLETGYMHNRVRMVAAGFLTKHLLIDWRWGEAWFAEKLLDYELASNNGNWQWVAGSGCDAAPYFRIFNPVIQAEKFDPERQYIGKWLKKDDISNSRPMIDHAFARKRAIAAYKELVSG